MIISKIVHNSKHRLLVESPCTEARYEYYRRNPVAFEQVFKQIFGISNSGVGRCFKIGGWNTSAGFVGSGVYICRYRYWGSQMQYAALFDAKFKTEL